jgi:cytochrome oxidase Cu insertion factor (SCO1/SenC/PrrC family)
VNLKMLLLASAASVSFVTMSAMAQTNVPPTSPEVNTPAAHKNTTVTQPNGKPVQTPPVGMRSGDKNVGGN